MSGGKGLVANLTMDQVIYYLCARTNAHHLIVRLTLRAVKFLIVDHSTPSVGFDKLHSCGIAVGKSQPALLHVGSALSTATAVASALGS